MAGTSAQITPSAKGSQCEHAVADLRSAVAALDTVEDLAKKVAELENVVAMLQNNRGLWCLSIQPELQVAVPSLPPADAPVPVNLIGSEFFPFVASSDRCSGTDRVGKVHKVVVGPPSSHLLWRTWCGWHFGGSAGASPVHTLPGSYKLMCERCHPVVRSAARDVAVAAAASDHGGFVVDHNPAAPPSQSRI